MSITYFLCHSITKYVQGALVESTFMSWDYNEQNQAMPNSNIKHDDVPYQLTKIIDIAIGSKQKMDHIRIVSPSQYMKTMSVISLSWFAGSEG